MVRNRSPPYPAPSPPKKRERKILYVLFHSPNPPVDPASTSGGLLFLSLSLSLCKGCQIRLYGMPLPWQLGSLSKTYMLSHSKAQRHTDTEKKN